MAAESELAKKALAVVESMVNVWRLAWGVFEVKPRLKLDATVQLDSQGR